MSKVLTPSLSSRAVDKVRTASRLVRDTERGKECSKRQVSWEGVVQMHGKASQTSHLNPTVVSIASVHALWTFPDQLTVCDGKSLHCCTKGPIGLVCADRDQISGICMHKGVEVFASPTGSHATPRHHYIAILVIICNLCPGEVQVPLQKMLVWLKTIAHRHCQG